MLWLVILLLILSPYPHHVDPADLDSSIPQSDATINTMFSYLSASFNSLQDWDIEEAKEQYMNFLSAYKGGDKGGGEQLTGLGDDGIPELSSLIDFLNTSIENASLINQHLQRASELKEEGKLGEAYNDLSSALVIAENLQQKKPPSLRVISAVPSFDRDAYSRICSQWSNLVAVPILLIEHELESKAYSNIVENELRVDHSTVVSPGEVVWVRGVLLNTSSSAPMSDVGVKMTFLSSTSESITDVEGRFRIEIPLDSLVDPGEYPILLSIPPTSHTVVPPLTLTVRVVPADGFATIILNDSNAYPTSPVSGQALLESNHMNIITEGKLLLDGTEIGDVKTGNFTVMLPSELVEGEHNLSVSFEHPALTTPVVAETSLIVRSADTHITLFAETGNNNVTLTGNLSTNYAPLSAPVHISVEGGDEVREYVTFALNGHYTLTVNNLKEGVYRADATFDPGKFSYLPSSTSIEFEVSPVAEKSGISVLGNYYMIYMALLALLAGIVVFIYMVRGRVYEILSMVGNLVKTGVPPREGDRKEKSEKQVSKLAESGEGTHVSMDEGLPPKPETILPPENEQDIVEVLYGELDRLEELNPSERVRHSYKLARDYLSGIAPINDTPNQTHREFESLVSRVLVGEVMQWFSHLTKLYEWAEFSGREVTEEVADEAVMLLKHLLDWHNKEENSSDMGNGGQP